MTIDFLPVILYPLGALAALCALWLATTYYIAKTSGWQQLQAVYPAPPKVTGTAFSNVGAIFNGAHYSGVLRLTANSEGIRWEVVRPFQFGTSPLFVPWVDIYGVEKKGVFRSLVELQFAKVPQVNVGIGKKLSDKLSEASKGSWKYMSI